MCMEEEIKGRKIPGVFFSTLLFLFFYLLLRTTYKDTYDMYYVMLDAAVAEDESVVLTFCTAALDIAMLTLSFWSLIRILKGKSDGITCIRWALVLNLFVLVYQVLMSLGQAILVTWQYSLLPMIQVALVLCIIVYLAKSKSIKSVYPKTERRFSPGGWVWLSFLFICILFFGIAIYSNIQKELNSKCLDLSTLSVPSGQLCDGRILFSSEQEWDRYSSTILNSDKEEQDVTLWELKQDSDKCHVWCGLSEKRRHSDFMTILLHSRPAPDSLFTKEIYSCDTVINNNQYFVDQYEYNPDSTKYVWTIATRFDSESNKYCAYSSFKKNMEPSQEQLVSIEFLKSVIFNLKPYIKEP